MNMRIKEMNYKLLTKLYYVPSKLHKFNPDVYHPYVGGSVGVREHMPIYCGTALLFIYTGKENLEFNQDD